MNDACDYLPSVPAKRLVALGAPHLVTSVDFTDSRTAARARFRLFFDIISAVDVFLLARMNCIVNFINNFKTLGAREILTQFAFVLCGQVAAAVAVRARHNELACLFLFFADELTTRFYHAYVM